jgi:hypothetical protein
VQLIGGGCGGGGIAEELNDEVGEEDASFARVGGSRRSGDAAELAGATEKARDLSATTGLAGAT